MSLSRMFEKLVTKYEIESLGVDGLFEVDGSAEVIVGRGLTAAEAKKREVPEGTKIFSIDGCDEHISRAALKMTAGESGMVVLEPIGENNVYVILASNELVPIRGSREISFSSMKTVYVGSPEDGSCFMLDLAGEEWENSFLFRILGLKVDGKPIRGAQLTHDHQTKGKDEMDLAEGLIGGR